MSISTEQFETTLHVPWGKLQYIIEWCTDNCKSDWHFGVVEDAGLSQGKYRFIFDSEKDYITFLLVTK